MVLQPVRMSAQNSVVASAMRVGLWQVFMYLSIEVRTIPPSAPVRDGVLTANRQ